MLNNTEADSYFIPQLHGARFGLACCVMGSFVAGIVPNSVGSGGYAFDLRILQASDASAAVLCSACSSWSL